MNGTTLRRNLVAVLARCRENCVSDGYHKCKHKVFSFEAAYMKVGLASDNSELLPASAHSPTQLASGALTRWVNAYTLRLPVLMNNIAINV